MAPGDSWKVEFTLPEAHGGQANAHWDLAYKVVGWTDVTTPAGTFHALEIKETGSTEAELIIPQAAAAAAVATPDGGATIARTQRAGRRLIRNTVYGETYYAPSIKYYVKFFEEQYNSDNVRTGRREDTLVSFKPGAAEASPAAR